LDNQQQWAEGHGLLCCPAVVLVDLAQVWVKAAK
jgi:hypothetical protein